MRVPRHVRQRRQRHQQVRRRQDEKGKWQSYLEVLGHTLHLGAALGLLIKGFRPSCNHARRRLVRFEYLLEALAVFATQHLEKIITTLFLFVTLSTHHIYFCRTSMLYFSYPR